MGSVIPSYLLNKQTRHNTYTFDNRTSETTHLYCLYVCAVCVFRTRRVELNDIRVGRTSAIKVFLLIIHCKLTPVLLYSIYNIYIIHTSKHNYIHIIQ